MWNIKITIMWQFLLPALGSAASSIIGSTVNSNANAKAQDRANAANMELAKYQNQANIDLWNKQNEYNTPQAQKSRLLAAGLNPALMYGQSASTGIASAPPKVEAPKVEAYTGRNLGIGQAGSSFFQTMQTMASVKNAQQQNSNLAAQESFTKQQTINLGLDAANKAIQNSRSELDLQTARELQKTTIDAAKENLMQLYLQAPKIYAENERIREEVKRLQFENEMKPAQAEQLMYSIQRLKLDNDMTEFENRLKKMGIYPQDQLWQRILARLVQHFVPSVGNLLAPPKIP